MTKRFYDDAVQIAKDKGKKLMVLGQGSGHGVGMSQWGARYMASKGQKAERILKHFYKGVRTVSYTHLTLPTKA